MEKERVGSNVIYTITEKGRVMLDLFTINEKN
jgi:hypothetical protein